MQKVDFLITSYLRWELLEKCIDSIFQFYPQAKVYVADQSGSWGFPVYLLKKYDKKVQFFMLPEDCGLSYARNYLVKNSRRPYKLILEDDFVFTEETKIEKMVEIMEYVTCSVIGGSVYIADQRLPFEFNFKKIGDELHQVSDGDNWQEKEGLKYKYTQCVLNFTLFKKEVFDDIIWDEELKLREHQDFFYRLTKTPHKVVFMPDIKIVDNKRNWRIDKDDERVKKYKEDKGRDEYMLKMMRKHGIKKIKHIGGMEVFIDNINNNKLTVG